MDQNFHICCSISGRSRAMRTSVLLIYASKRPNGIRSDVLSCNDLFCFSLTTRCVTSRVRTRAAASPSSDCCTCRNTPSSTSATSDPRFVSRESFFVTQLNFRLSRIDQPELRGLSCSTLISFLNVMVALQFLGALTSLFLFCNRSRARSVTT